jgi:hypothetical protein
MLATKIVEAADVRSIFPIKRGRIAPPVFQASMKETVGKRPRPSRSRKWRRRFHDRCSKAWTVPPKLSHCIRLQLDPVDLRQNLTC